MKPCRKRSAPPVILRETSARVVTVGRRVGRRARV